MHFERRVLFSTESMPSAKDHQTLAQADHSICRAQYSKTFWIAAHGKRSLDRQRRDNVHRTSRSCLWVVLGSLKRLLLRHARCRIQLPRKNSASHHSRCSLGMIHPQVESFEALVPQQLFRLVGNAVDAAISPPVFILTGSRRGEACQGRSDRCKSNPAL